MGVSLATVGGASLLRLDSGDGICVGGVVVAGRVARGVRRGVGATVGSDAGATVGGGWAWDGLDLASAATTDGPGVRDAVTVRVAIAVTV